MQVVQRQDGGGTYIANGAVFVNFVLQRLEDGGAEAAR